MTCDWLVIWGWEVICDGQWLAYGQWRGTITEWPQPACNDYRETLGCQFWNNMIQTLVSYKHYPGCKVISKYRIVKQWTSFICGMVGKWNQSSSSQSMPNCPQNEGKQSQPSHLHQLALIQAYPSIRYYSLYLILEPSFMPPHQSNLDSSYVNWCYTDTC